MKKTKLYIALSLVLANSISFAAVTVSSPNVKTIASSTQVNSQSLAYKTYQNSQSTLAFYTEQVKIHDNEVMIVQKTLKSLTEKLNNLIAYSKTKLTKGQLEITNSKIREVKAELVKVNIKLKEKKEVALGYSTKLNMAKTEVLQSKAAYLKSKISTATGEQKASLMLQVELAYAQLDKHLAYISYVDAVNRSNANKISEGVPLTYLIVEAKARLEKASANLLQVEASIAKFKAKP